MAYQRVIKGTKQAKQVGVTYTQHRANLNKMRCQGCGIGYMVKIETTGGSVWRCGRCSREASISDF